MHALDLFTASIEVALRRAFGLDGEVDGVS